MEGNIISFLVGTIHSETYEEDEYKITIKFNDKQYVIIIAYKTLIFHEGVIWWLFHFCGNGTDKIGQI